MGKYFKVRISDWTMDFRYVNYQDASEFGVCYSQTKQVWITLQRHESFEQIIDTIVHEALHMAIRDDTVSRNEDDEMDMAVKMDGEQEHELMKRVFWFMNEWI